MIINIIFGFFSLVVGIMGYFVYRKVKAQERLIKSLSHKRSEKLYSTEFETLLYLISTLPLEHRIKIVHALFSGKVRITIDTTNNNYSFIAAYQAGEDIDELIKNDTALG